ncbi:MAG: cobalt ECF transporter T component CbiQ [Deltaproteobacteria bacterium]|nr:cobalt ECF transporter T component CbiQ [Deltaproteobacteria bacterium]
MIEEGFSQGNSLLHRLDARVKILWVVLFSVVTAVCDQWPVLTAALALALAVALALALAVAFMARVAPRELVRRLMPVNLFVIFLWLVLPFTVTGDPSFTLGPLVATRQGILYATQISVKSNAIVIALIALITSTSILTLGHAMHALRVPRKIVYLFFFTYRYIFVIYREYIRLKEAMKIRGFCPGTNLHTYKTYAYLVGMILVRSSERAERVHQAMLCRGFRGRLYSLSDFSMRTADMVWMGAMSACVVVLGLWNG